MIYGFDIDDTINDCTKVMDTVVLDFAKEHNLTINYNKHGYFCDARYGFSKEDSELFWNERGLEIYSKCTLIPEAVALIKRVKAQGNKVYFLTGRWEHFRDITEKSLKADEIQYDGLIMGLKRKDLAAKELNLDYMFEDAEDFLSLLVGAVPNLYAKEHSHNASLIGTEGITFFKDWSELHI